MDRRRMVLMMGIGALAAAIAVPDAHGDPSRRWAPVDRVPPPTAPQVRASLNRPANPALLVYGDNPSTANAASWAHKGAVVVVGRTNYDESWVRTMADGGATILIYLNPVIKFPSGRYHDKLLNASEFGPAVPNWP